MRRIVSLWLPHLAVDRVTRRGAALAAWRDRAVVTLTAVQGGLRVAAASPAAQAAGIQSGLAVADARALLPDVKTLPGAPADDLACLAALADWCGRYTPWVATDGLDPDGGGGLMLDVSGCAHLFGGEAALLDDLTGRLTALGFTSAAAIADTPAAAWAACRFGREAGARTAVVPEGAARQLLAGLPVAALRLPAAAIEILHRLGLRRIGDLYGLPRAPLAARFGEVVARRLDQLLGAAPEPISPVRPASPHHARLAFAEPIARGEDVVAALDHLLETLCAGLALRKLGARRLDLAFYRVDGSVARLGVGTAQPVRAPIHLARLFARGLDSLDAGFGFEAASLTAVAVEPLGAAQLDMTDRRHDQVADDVGLLVDRLGNRLGRGGVVRLARLASHIPERAVRPAPPLSGRDAPAPKLPPRPPRLLVRPERIEADGNGGPPAMFRWRNESVRVARAEGPERIAAEWWHAATPPPPSAMRDYWRVEDGSGRRFWLYREGPRGPWLVHGVFA
jgi:protein ImuB